MVQYLQHRIGHVNTRLPPGELHQLGVVTDQHLLIVESQPRRFLDTINLYTYMYVCMYECMYVCMYEGMIVEAVMYIDRANVFSGLLQNDVQQYYTHV